MNTFGFKLVLICMVLAMLMSVTKGFKRSRDDIDSQTSEDLEFEMPRARSHTFLRTLMADDDDDDSPNQDQRFIRRDQFNTTHYKDRKGRTCLLCKWGMIPCCEPNICQKHHIRFNECIEVKSQ